MKLYLGSAGLGGKVVKFLGKETICAQGDPAETVVYIRQGGVRVSVVNENGKEAVVAILEAGDFFGEEYLAGRSTCLATAIALVPTTALLVEKAEMIRALQKERKFSDHFIAYILSRNIRVEEDLISQLFNSSEKRLARTLLLLAHHGVAGRPQNTLPKVSQETLAEMIGTTRSRVNFFMNRFRKLGFIRYDGTVHVNNSLVNIVLRD